MKPSGPGLVSSQPGAGRSPIDVEWLVRDALRHLYDPVSLRAHPLTARLTGPEPRASVRGERLHQVLLDAIASLKPVAGASDPRPARRYELLSLRYVEAREVDDVAASLGISRREFSRLHRQALDAVVTLLTESDALDLSAPVQPANRADHGPSAPERLPTPLSSFVGRARALREVRQLVEIARLTTVTGPPGVGKTRLVLQLAADLAAASGDARAPFPDGIVFIPLATIDDPDLVLPLIAQGVKARERPNQALLDALVDVLQSRRILLVLDNVEHLLAAAPVVPQLLAACPQLRMLITSREALRLTGEREYVLSPLEVPADRDLARLDELAACEAVRLYLDRASDTGSRFQLNDQNARAVVLLCRRLDGLPLAIELAAARSKVFPPYLLLERLMRTDRALEQLKGGARDAIPRQQTLRTAIDWSYQLLTADEQRLFARLSVFAGGWSLAAAEAVCARAGEPEVVDTLAALVDKSLVQTSDQPAGDVRFSMLETMRVFAREQLALTGDEATATRRRHAEYFLDLARQARAHYFGPDQSAWHARVHRHLANVRAALSWARESGDIDLALQLANALHMYWFDSGLRSEGRAWFERLLQQPGASGRTAERAWALTHAGECCWLLGEFTAARARFAEGYALFQALQERRGEAWALHDLGVIDTELGDLAAARIKVEQALALAREHGDRPLVALALNGLSLLAVQQREVDVARFRIEECRQVWQELGDREHEAIAVKNAGDVAMLAGQDGEAGARYQESLDLIGDAGPQGWRAVSLARLAIVRRRQGDAERARELFLEALVWHREAHDQRGQAECLAGLASLEEAPVRTARLGGAAAAALDATGARMNQFLQVIVDQGVADARRRLGDETFAGTWQQGRSVPLDQAVKEVMRMALDGADA